WGMDIHAMSLVVLGATFCYAVSGVMLRLLSRHDSDVVALFWLSLATSAASLVGAIPAWVWPTPIDWVWLLVMGLLGGMGQILSTRAWRVGAAAVVGPCVRQGADLEHSPLAVGADGRFGALRLHLDRAGRPVRLPLVQGGAFLDGLGRPAAGDRLGARYSARRAD